MKIYRLRVFYKKEGISRFISHLSFCKIIERSLRRLDIPMRFSNGFTPNPKISYCPPLPIPIVGTNEFFELEVKDIFDLNLFIEKINQILPEGTEIKNCFWVEKKAPLSSIYGIYFIPINEKIFREDIEKEGKIIEEKDKFIKAIFKMEKFNHKNVFKYGLFDGIKRELFITDE
ncbi:MAG: TIGR03936 family radical SAM-associated protein [Candidatus Omnitrophica bacterium]|nr:TIGR03936 family radical SAM-associated protein [Candidatus Omnitrophota bacterium]